MRWQVHHNTQRHTHNSKVPRTKSSHSCCWGPGSPTHRRASAKWIFFLTRPMSLSSIATNTTGCEILANWPKMPCSHTFCLFSLTRKEFSLTLRNPIKEQHIHVECSSRLISENPANSPGTSLTSSSVSCRKSARPTAQQCFVDFHLGQVQTWHPWVLKNPFRAKPSDLPHSFSKKHNKFFQLSKIPTLVPKLCGVQNQNLSTSHSLGFLAGRTCSRSL